ncbi:lipopolysaccharide biosynthesis protein [Vibrio nomapromontoriensis]|uniref:lipopolysaccharide biosynthesis protein n=1 Tax=Vibrio nomapromontoriensis TaxID=2910246 RepID=UPI003D09A905
MTEPTLKKRYLVKLMASLVSGIVSIIMVAIIPKAVGPIAYGQLVYIQQFFTKVMSFLDASSSIAFFTKLSANSKRKQLIGWYGFYSLVLLVSLLGFFYISNLLNFNEYVLPGISIEYIYLGISFAFLTWFSQVCTKVGDAFALTVPVEGIKVIYKLVSLCALLGLIGCFSLTIKIYLYFQTITLIVFITCVLFFLLKEGVICSKAFSCDFEGFKYTLSEFFSYCKPLFFYSTMTLLVGLFDIWILQKSSGSLQTGYYGLSYSLAAMCFIFTGAMTPIITREFSRSFELSDITGMANTFRRYIPMLFSIAAYFSIFISFQSENVLTIFTDEEFKGAQLVLMVMAFYPIHQTYGQLSGSIFYATGQTKLYCNIGLFSMLLGLILTVLFVWVFNLGALGLAAKMLITQLIGVNVQLFFNSKLLGLKLIYFLKHQICVIISFSFIAYASSVYVVMYSPLTNFLLSGFIYTLFIMLIVLLFPKLFSLTRSELINTIMKMTTASTK